MKITDTSDIVVVGGNGILDGRYLKRFRKVRHKGFEEANFRAPPCKKETLDLAHCQRSHYRSRQVKLCDQECSSLPIQGPAGDPVVAFGPVTKLVNESGARTTNTYPQLSQPISRHCRLRISAKR